MFTTFDRGREQASEWEDATASPAYQAGRFRAHLAPSSPRRPRRVSVTVPSPIDDTAPLDAENEPVSALWFAPLLQLRPRRTQVEAIISRWPIRVFVQMLLPTIVVLAWVAVPVPTFDPNKADPPQEGEGYLAVDINFGFFLLWFFGLYLAVSLLFVTSLFNLYRLNWWPSGPYAGRISYVAFWGGGLVAAALFHHFALLGSRGRRDVADDVDWERKTLLIGITYATMSLPALLCFAKLRRDRRGTYRHSLTDTQKTFLERQLSTRIPRSYIRFLWFVLSISVALFVLPAGQAFAAVYMKTLPHTSQESLIYVWTWVIAVQLLGFVTAWILEVKVRSKALLFVFRLYSFLAYHVFLRNLFARLRSPDQFAILQFFSSSWVVFFYPVSMSNVAYRALCLFGYDKTREAHRESVAETLYLRQLSENATMCAFLAWLTVLHFGANRDLFPFFRLVPSDAEFSYTLTASASAIVWATELASTFFARRVCWWIYGVRVRDVGGIFVDYPELMPATLWTICHTLMSILLFLVRLQFK